MIITENNTAKKKTTTATIAQAEKIKEIKILGAIANMNNDGRTYYIGSDDENYFLFIGRTCDNPNNYLRNYYDDDMWDNIP